VLAAHSVAAMVVASRDQMIGTWGGGMWGGGMWCGVGRSKRRGWGLDMGQAALVVADAAAAACSVTSPTLGGLRHHPREVGARLGRLGRSLRQYLAESSLLGRVLWKRPRPLGIQWLRRGLGRGGDACGSDLEIRLRARR